SAVLGEALAARRSGEDAREIERANSGERPHRGFRLFRRRIPDADDLDKRLLGHRFRLRMALPDFGGAREARASCSGMDRILERLAGPGGALPLGFLAIG